MPFTLSSPPDIPLSPKSSAILLNLYITNYSSKGGLSCEATFSSIKASCFLFILSIRKKAYDNLRVEQVGNFRIAILYRFLACAMSI